MTSLPQTARCKTVRLQAELLEPRLMMSADSAPRGELHAAMLAALEGLSAANDSTSQFSAGVIGSLSRDDVAAWWPATELPYASTWLNTDPHHLEQFTSFQQWLETQIDQQWGAWFGVELVPPPTSTTPLVLTEIPAGGPTHFPNPDLELPFITHPLPQVSVLPPRVPLGREVVWSTSLIDYSGLAARDLQPGTTPYFAGTLSPPTDTTSAQIAGIDEADIVETDGEYVYIVSQGVLRIVDARDAARPVIVASLALTGTVTGMYRHGDRLAILSMGESQLGSTGDGIYSLVTVLDISDRAQPALVQASEFAGRVIASRSVEGQLRLAIRTEDPVLPAHLPTLQTVTEGGKQRYETRREYLERVWQQLTANLPTYASANSSGEVDAPQLMLEWNELIAALRSNSPNVTSVVSIDMTSQRVGPVDIATAVDIPPGATVALATDNDLYLFTTVGGDTRIDKFQFSARGQIRLASSGVVAGTLLGQFAVDEHDGHLRVVTTVGDDPRVTILREQGHTLVEVGVLAGFATGDEIKAVRFAGTRAYIVTYRQVDPLFLIDLSDPSQPRVVGEAVIPGYSYYLQVLDDNHVLAVGRESHLEVSIFDFTDPTAPRQTHIANVVDDPFAQSTAGGEHLAITYLANEGLLAIPYTEWGYGMTHTRADGSPADFNPKAGLALFRVDAENGFERIASIHHREIIQRSLSVGATLAAVSPSTISLHPLANAGSESSRLELVGAPTTTIHFTHAPPLTVPPPLVTENELPAPIATPFWFDIATGGVGSDGTLRLRRDAAAPESTEHQVSALAWESYASSSTVEKLTLDAPLIRAISPGGSDDLFDAIDSSFANGFAAF